MATEKTESIVLCASEFEIIGDRWNRHANDRHSVNVVSAFICTVTGLIAFFVKDGVGIVSAIHIVNGKSPASFPHVFCTKILI